MTSLLAAVREAQGDKEGAATLMAEARRLAANDPAMRSFMGLGMARAPATQPAPGTTTTGPATKP
jgi:hypothetical protein